MKRVFIQILPKILFIERPMIAAAANNNKIKQNENNTKLKSKLINDNAKYSSKLPVSIRRALNGVSYMHGRMIKDDIDRKVKKNKHLILI